VAHEIGKGRAALEIDPRALLGPDALDVLGGQRRLDGAVQDIERSVGRRLGANRPYQVLTSKSGTPASAKVGTSGKIASRLAVATASARRRAD